MTSSLLRPPAVKRFTPPPLVPDAKVQAIRFELEWLARSAAWFAIRRPQTATSNFRKIPAVVSSSH